MGTRAGRTLVPFGLRYLRRQLHSDHGKHLPPVLSENLAMLSSAISSSSFSSVEGRINGGPQELCYVNTKRLDPEGPSFESAQKLSMNEFFGSGSWHLQNASPSQDGSSDEWSIGRVSGYRFSQGIRRWTSGTIAKVHGNEAAIFRDQDFFSRYLSWRKYDLSVSLVSRNYLEAAAVNSVDMDGLVSLTRQNCEKRFPSLLLSSSSLDFLEKPSMVIPLEADSVKRKRKKKMNKHKQRKLRRRDRHRN